MKNKLIFNKRKLWFMIANDIKHIIHYSHIFSVINILLDELVLELKTGREIKIKNFGTFKLKNLKPKKIRSIATGNIKFAKRTKSLRFSIANKLNKLLTILNYKNQKG